MRLPRWGVMRWAPRLRKGRAARAGAPASAGALLLALLLTPLAGSAQTTPDAPALPAQAASVAGFVPPGWVIEQQHAADLNRDGRRDALLLLRRAPAAAQPGEPGTTGSTVDGGAGRSPLRLLAVLLGARGGYALSALNARLIPQVDLASQDDPLTDGELAARPGGFDIKLGLVAGVGSYLSASLRYRFRYQGGCFRLIGYDRLETHRATLNTHDLSINFLNGAAVHTSGNAQSDATQVRRDRLAANPRRCFQDLDNAADFKPL